MSTASLSRDGNTNPASVAQATQMEVAGVPDGFLGAIRGGVHSAVIRAQIGAQQQDVPAYCCVDPEDPTRKFALIPDLNGRGEPIGTYFLTEQRQGAYHVARTDGGAPLAVAAIEKNGQRYLTTWADSAPQRVLGKIAAPVPTVRLRGEARPDSGLITAAKPIPVPGTSFVLEPSGDFGGGAFSKVFPAELRSTKSRLGVAEPVFVKVVEHSRSFSRLEQAEEALSRIYARDGDKSLFSRTKHLSVVSLPELAARGLVAPGQDVGLVVDQLVPGKNLEVLRDEAARNSGKQHEAGPRSDLPLHQVCAIGALLADGLRRLNADAKPGEEIVYTDLNPRNVIVPDDGIDRAANGSVRQVKIVDKGGVMSARTPGDAFEGTFEFTPLLEVQSCIQAKNFACHGAMHAFSVGRVMSALVLGDLPEAESREQKLNGAYSDRVATLVERAMEKQAADAPHLADASRRLAKVIRASMDPSMEERMPLATMVKELRVALAESGHPAGSELEVRDERSPESDLALESRIADKAGRIFAKMRTMFRP